MWTHLCRLDLMPNFIATLDNNKIALLRDDLSIRGPPAQLDNRHNTAAAAILATPSLACVENSLAESGVVLLPLIQWPIGCEDLEAVLDRPVSDDKPWEPWNDPPILAGLRPGAIREEVQKTASDSLREIRFR